MKIKSIYKIKKDGAGRLFFNVVIGKGFRSKVITIEADANLEKQIIEAEVVPVLTQFGNGNCIYKNYVINVEDIGDNLDEEDILRIKHFVLSKEKGLNKLKKEVEAFESFDKAQVSKREKIPDSVRLFVWQRDEGKCVKCNKKEKLEFDHIIPVIEGGSNTERNIQLLCEGCNRSKGKNIQ